MSNRFSRYAMSFGLIVMTLIAGVKTSSAQCQADFVMNPSLNVVAFMDKSIPSDTMNGNIVGLMWDFGDGQMDTSWGYAPNPIHFYEKAGIYTVSLMMLDDSGCVDSTNQILELSEDLYVWPGDANSDGMVSFTDVFSVGLAWGEQGTARIPKASSWGPNAGFDWPGTFRDSTNIKHADCNGDGFIDHLDVDVIRNNYGSMKQKSSTPACQVGDPPIEIIFPADTVNAGDTIVADIMFGDAVDPADNIFGVGFSLDYDESKVDSGTAKIEFNSSWLGTVSNTSHMVIDNHNQGTIDIGIVKTDGSNSSGFGKIGVFIIVMEDDLIGFTDFGVSFVGDVKAISFDETEKEVCEQTTSVTISSGVNDRKRISNISVYPNPTEGMLNIGGVKNINEIKLINTIGQEVRNLNHSKQSDQLSLDVSDVENGIYMIQLIGDTETITKRIMISK